MDTSLILQAATHAAGGQQYPAPALYIVATPIGNLADLSLRALHVLALADAVACEDTRVSAPLLQRFGLHKPLIALHEHNEVDAAARVMQRLDRGERVAYVSDAGTPAISDPGAVLVAQVRARGFRALPIPGPSSALAALSIAGDIGAGAFRFEGFLPAKGPSRRAALDRLLADPLACVLFEAPHRIENLADLLAAQAPTRQVTLCRELTKQFETTITRPAAELPVWLASDPAQRRGEFVLVIHASAALPAGDAASALAPAFAALAVLMQELPLKQAVGLCAQLYGAPRNVLYAQALASRTGASEAVPPT